MKPFKFILIAAALLQPILSTVSTARESFVLVRFRGDVAEGTDGRTFSNFDYAVINNNDELAYRGSLNSGFGVGTFNNEGIWTDSLDGSFFELIARENSVAPGTGNQFTGIVEPSTFQMNDAGSLAFRGVLKGLGVNNTNDVGIWSRPSAGTLKLVAREGDAAAGTDGNFGLIGFPAQSQDPDGDLFFRASLDTNSGTVSFFDDSAIYAYDGGTCALSLVAREGDATPVLPIGAGGIPGTPATYGQILGDVACSDDGAMLFAAILTGVPSPANQGLFIRSATGIVSLLYQSGIPMPDATGVPTPAVILGFIDFAINDDDEVALRVGLQFGVGGVGSTNNEALLTDAGGVLRLLAQKGDVTPEGGNTFTIFRNILIGNSGATGFIGTLSTGIDGIYSASAGGPLANIAKEDTTAPGTDADYILLQPPAMNHMGQLLYTSSLRIENTTTTADNAGLWRTDMAATPPTADGLISRKGDFDYDTCGTVVAINVNATVFPTDGVSGSGRAINDTGNLVVTKQISLAGTGSGGIQGVYILGDRPPVFCDPPEDILINIPEGSGPIAVAWTPPTVTDDNDPAPMVSSTHMPGDMFGPGVTIVTYTAMDNGGNTSTFRFRIIITEIRDIGQTFSAEIVASKGDAAPSSDTFNTFGSVCVNENDEVVIEGSTASNLRGVWAGPVTGPLENVALRDNPALVGALEFQSFSDIRINRTDKVSFSSILKPGLGPLNDRALYIEDTGFSLNLAAYESDDAPDSAGAPTGRLYKQLYTSAHAQSTTLNANVFPATLLPGGGGGVTFGSDSGIWTFDADTATGRELVSEGAAIAALPGFSHGHIPSRVVTGGETGIYVFSSLLTGPGVSGFNNEALFVGSLGGPIVPLLRESDSAAGPNDASSQFKKDAKLERRDQGRYQSFLTESISPDGSHLAFLAVLRRDGRVTADTDTGIWLINAAGDLLLVAREGHQAPGFPEGVCFDRFDDVTVTNDGGVWFKAFLEHDDELGINSSNDCGHWTNSDGFLRWMLHEGVLAPNTDGVATRLLLDFAYHEGGYAAVIGLAVGAGDVSFRDDNCLLSGFDALTGLFQINQREGDMFDLTAGDTRQLLNFRLDPHFGPQGGSGGFCNAVHGGIDRTAFRATFDGNSSGVFVRDLSDVGP